MRSEQMRLLSAAALLLCFLGGMALAPVVFSAVTTKNPEGEMCTRSDIALSQASTKPLPDGIPTYKVEITNLCATGCAISNIHISCGAFSSATLVKPDVFKRLAYDDCLVNSGKPLAHGTTLSFQYSTTYPYPLSVKSVSCPRTNKSV